MRNVRNRKDRQWIERRWDRVIVFLLHDVSLRNVFFLNLFKLVNILLHISPKNGEIIDEILMSVPNILSTSVILNETKLFFCVMVKHYPALLGLKRKRIINK